MMSGCVPGSRGRRSGSGRKKQKKVLNQIHDLPLSLVLWDA